MSKNLDRLRRIFKKNLNTVNLNYVRGQYFDLKYKYKATCMKEIQKFEIKLLQNRENLNTSNMKNSRIFQSKPSAVQINKIPGYQILPTLTDLDKHSKDLLQKNSN